MRYFIMKAALLVTTVGCLSPRFDVSRTERRTIEPDELRSIDLSTYNGWVTVESHDASNIEMEVTFKAYGGTEAAAKDNCASLKCVVTEEDGTLKIKATKPLSQRSASASFMLKVPADCPVALNTSNGTVTVKDIQAKVDINTSNGTIQCEGLKGPLAAKTSNGAIRVQDCECDIRLTTSNGKVSYAGRLAGDQNEIHTSNGSVTLAVPTGEVTEVLAKTSNGRVQCDLPTHRVLEKGKSSLHAIIGDGKGDEAKTKISIRSSNGSIKIEKQAPA